MVAYCDLTLHPPTECIPQVSVHYSPWSGIMVPELLVAQQGIQCRQRANGCQLVHARTS